MRNLRGSGRYKDRGSPTVLASPSFTAGWATFGVPLAQGDLPSGQSLKVSGLDTQTDVKTTWGDGSAKFAIVTCKPTGTGSLNVSQGSPATGSFTPAVPAASVVFTVYDRLTLLGDYSITSGTLKVVLSNAAGSGTMVADAIYIETLDGSGNPTGTNYTVDNSDGSPGYVESGTWGDGGSGYKSASNHGVGGSVRHSTDASATATWTKTDLASGTYRVSVSWVLVPNEADFGISSTTQASYEVFDDDTSRGELLFNQKWDSGEVGGTTLGDFSVTSGTCNVILGNDTAASSVYAFGERVAIFKDGVLIASKDYNDAGITLSGFAGTSGYATVGSSGNVYFSAAAPAGSNTLTYQFTGLDSGTYRIVVWSIWGKGGDSIANGINGTALASDAPWTVKDDSTSRGTVDVNQKTWSGRTRAITFTATLNTSAGDDTWLDGSLCKEWRKFQVPVDGSANPHPALLVIWDIRCFNDDSARVQVTVENTYQKARVKEVYYDVAITVDGEEVFTEDELEHFVACRWTKIFTVDLTESTVTPDFTRAHSSAAKLLPKYSSDIADTFDPGSYGLPSGGQDRWKVLRPGGISQYNMYTGDVNYVGPFPTWVAVYLTHGDADAREYMLETARNSMAAYPVHYRHTDNTIYDPETNSNFWPDARNPSANTTVDFGAIVRPSFRHYLGGDQSHHPQAVLPAYLLTGERHLADEMAFWIVFQIVAAGGSRLGAEMVLQSVEARGAGWSLRTVAENTTFLPDDHEVKDWGETSVTNTVAFHEDYANGDVKYYPQDRLLDANSPITYMDITAGNGSDITGGIFPQISANWQNAYVVYGIQRARDLGLVSASVAANAMNRLTAFSIGAFSQHDSGSPDDPALSTWPVSCNEMKLINQGFDAVNAVCTDNAAYFKNWNVSTGTAGTHVVVGTRNESYGGLGCLKFVSDGSTLAAVYQEFNKANSNLADAGGTADTLANSTSYYLVFWLKISEADTTGTMIFELVDDSGNVHNSNQFTVNVNTLTTSFVRKVFTITTATLPGTYRLRIRFGTSPTSERTIYLGPITVYQVPGATRVQSTGFYGTVGFSQSGTINFHATWDELFAGAIAGGRASAMPFPSENNFSEHQLILDIAERLGLSGATDAYDLCLAHANFACRDNFNFIRGMYV